MSEIDKLYPPTEDLGQNPERNYSILCDGKN